MRDVDLQDLKRDVYNIYYQNIEEVILMAKYCFIAYIKSIMSFGLGQLASSNVAQIWKEFLAIIREEKVILRLLLQSGILADVDEVDDFLFELDEINTKTIQYYYSVLDGVETACEMKTEWRAVRPKKNFKTLLDTDEYRKKICSIILSMEDVKSFLNYGEDFWNYIKEKILFIDSHIKEDQDFYGVNIKLDDHDCLVDMKVLVPQIINLETALVVVHELNHAYSLYQGLGSSIVKSDLEYEEDARNCEKAFLEDYMVKKYQKCFVKRRF